MLELLFLVPIVWVAIIVWLSYTGRDVIIKDFTREGGKPFELSDRGNRDEP